MEGRHGLARRARPLDDDRTRGRERTLQRTVDHPRPILVSENLRRIHGDPHPSVTAYSGNCRPSNRMIAELSTRHIADCQGG